MKLDKFNQLLEKFSREEIRYEVGSHKDLKRCIIVNGGEWCLGLNEEPQVKIIVNNVWTLTEEGVVDIESDEQ